jgi:hypothetical protein
MSIENRQMPRYQDFARARIQEMCQLPGYLEDVSRNGCKVRFSHVNDIDTDREYTLQIQPAPKSGIAEFSLVVQPQWVRRNGDTVDVGFSVLHSPGIRQFSRYVEHLEDLEAVALQEA